MRPAFAISRRTGKMSNANDEEGRLQRGEDDDEKRAVRGGIAVVVGLVLEVAYAYAYAYAKGQSIVEVWSPVLADICVAGGVAAEAFFAARARSKAAKLKIISDAGVTAGNDRAADALLQAAQANERAELLRAENLAIQEAIQPRRLGSQFALARPDSPDEPPLSVSQFEGIRKFPGTEVYVRTSEAERDRQKVM
jgi:hypothetical protein